MLPAGAGDVVKKADAHDRFSVYLLYWYKSGTKVQRLTLRGAAGGCGEECVRKLK